MPSSTPRSIDTIVNSIQTNAADVNPAMDLRKGPLGVLLWAFSGELSRAETNASYLVGVHQFENADLIEPQDLTALGRNYGKNPNIGRATRTLVHFYRYARPAPNKTYQIPAGSSVSSSDTRFVYNTLNSVIMDGNYADIYFNPTNHWYEIPVLVEAIAVGSDYDLPPQTITKLLSGLEDFDGCVNKFDVRRTGSDQAAPIQFINSLQNTMQGIGTDLAGKMVDILQDIDPTAFDDVGFVPSTDYTRFVRGKALHGSLGYDLYVISDSVQETLQEGVAKGGEITIPLTYKPALSVAYVSVNGLPVTFTFEQDQDPQFQGSPLCDDKVRLTTPLLPLQTYQISYIYYDFVYQGNEAFKGRSRPFQTDVLVRRANPVQIYVSGELSVQGTADRNQVVTDLQTFTQKYFRDPTLSSSYYRTFVTSLDPNDYVATAKTIVSGLSNLRLTGFIRLDRAFLPIERILFDGATEYPLLFKFEIT